MLNIFLIVCTIINMYIRVNLLKIFLSYIDIKLTSSELNHEMITDWTRAA